MTPRPQTRCDWKEPSGGLPEARTVSRICAKRCATRKAAAARTNALATVNNRDGVCVVSQRQPRSPALQAALIVLVAALGIGSRRFALALPEFVAAYAGDTLWA